MTPLPSHLHALRSPALPGPLSFRERGAVALLIAIGVAPLVAIAW